MRYKASFAPPVLHEKAIHVADWQKTCKVFYMVSNAMGMPTTRAAAMGNGQGYQAVFLTRHLGTGTKNLGTGTKVVCGD